MAFYLWLLILLTKYLFVTENKQIVYHLKFLNQREKLINTYKIPYELENN